MWNVRGGGGLTDGTLGHDSRRGFRRNQSPSDGMACGCGCVCGMQGSRSSQHSTRPRPCNTAPISPTSQHRPGSLSPVCARPPPMSGTAPTAVDSNSNTLPFLSFRSSVRDIDPTNDLTFLRIRSKKHEILVAPRECCFFGTSFFHPTWSSPAGSVLCHLGGTGRAADIVVYPGVVADAEYLLCVIQNPEV